MMKTKLFRMRLSTFKRIRRNVKPRIDETCADYFDRLSKHLIQIQGGKK